MKKLISFLWNIKSHAEDEIFEQDFITNLKRFHYMLNEENFALSAIAFDEFANSIPDYLLGVSKQKNVFEKLQEDAEQLESGKLSRFTPLVKDEVVSAEFVLTENKKIKAMRFFNLDGEELVISSKSEAVVYTRKNKKFKLVNMFKDHVTFEFSNNSGEDFKVIRSMQKEEIDSKIEANNMLWGR